MKQFDNWEIGYWIVEDKGKYVVARDVFNKVWKLSKKNIRPLKLLQKIDQEMISLNKINKQDIIALIFPEKVDILLTLQHSSREPEQKEEIDISNTQQQINQVSKSLDGDHYMAYDSIYDSISVRGE